MLLPSLKMASIFIYQEESSKWIKEPKVLSSLDIQ